MTLRRSRSESERTLAEAPVHGKPHALFFPGKTGVLKCTEHQIVFDGGRIRTTVSLDTVTSLEFQKPKWSKAYLYTGIASLTYGIVGGTPDSGLATFGFVVGIVLLVTGYWLRTSRLAIHTPTEVYRYTSRGDALGRIAHACWGASDRDPQLPVLLR